MTGKERDLLCALVNNEEFVNLYGTSAIFYTQMNTLVQMVPLWVKGMADHAVEHEQQQRAAVELAMKGTK